MNSFRIAGGAGYVEDHPDAAWRQVRLADADYLVLCYQTPDLARKLLAAPHDPPPQHQPDSFLKTVRRLAPELYLRPDLRVLVTSGDTSPGQLAQRAAAILCRAGSTDYRITAVGSRDLTDRLEELLQAGLPLEHAETGQPLAELKLPIRAARALLRVPSLRRALAMESQLTIAGLVHPEALTIAAAAHAAPENWDSTARRAAAAVAGAYLAAGCRTTWNRDAPPPVLPGYPVVDWSGTGEITMSITPTSDGGLSDTCLAEFFRNRQPGSLVWKFPEVQVDISKLRLASAPAGQWIVEQVQGEAGDNLCEVLLCYQDGFRIDGWLLATEPYGEFWNETDALLRARLKHQADKLTMKWLTFGQAARVEITSHAPDQLELAALEISRLPHCGPPGLIVVGEAPPPRPYLKVWPTKIDSKWVEVAVDCRPASEWT